MRMVMRREFCGRLAMLGAIALLSLLASFPETARAGLDQLSGCVNFTDAVQQEDGNIVAIGNHGECSYWKDLPNTRARSNLLVGLGQDGEPKGGFGVRGVTLIPADSGEQPYEVIQRPDGGFVAVSNQKIRAYSLLGQPVSGFGDRGEVRLPGLQGAAVHQTGIYTVQRIGSEITRVSRFDLGGNPVESYGSGGSVEVPFGTSIAPAVDSEGRVILVRREEAFRVKDDGTVDTGFGPHGTGVADLDVTAPEPAYIFFEDSYRVVALPGDKIRVYFSGIRQMYSQQFFTTDLQENGVPPANPIGGAGHVNFRGMTDVFTLFSSGWDPQERMFRSSPGSSWMNRSIELEDGSVLGVGATNGPHCEIPDCRSDSRGMLVMVSGATGDPVSGFGTRGIQLIPENECPWGQAGAKGSRKIGDWNVCRVKRPKTRHSMVLKNSKRSKATLDIRVDPGSPPAGLRGTIQNVDIFLPKGLPLRVNWQNRAKAWVYEEGGLGRKARVEFTGNRMSVRAVPPLKPGWEYEDVSDPHYSFRFVLGPGAIKPRLRLLQTRTFRSTIRTKFTPRDPKWIAPNWSHVTLKVRVGNRKRSS